MYKSWGHANLGRSLEELIIHSNNQYKAKGAALIQKVATPWTVIRRGKQIVSAFPAEKSTVDFIGVVSGVKPVAFDAKQCKQSRFPLSYIEGHQMNFLYEWQSQGGEAFFVIEMVELNQIFRLPLDVMCDYFNNATALGGRKSIPLEDFKDLTPLKSAGGVALDYLGLYSK
jgi:recombination protein U